MLKQRPIEYLLFLILLLAFLFIGFGLQRHETLLLLAFYTILFGIYCWIILKSKGNSIEFWFYASVLFRIVLLFSVPTLSDDFYRFIWDGRLLVSGYHPFAHIPSYYIENSIAIPGIDKTLFSNLNSKDYFTVYPPLAQLLFWLSAKLSSSVYGNLLILKSFILVSEAGSILLIRKILNRFMLPAKNVLIYALNPLVILELTGNAHMEGILIFFILLSCYFLIQYKISASAIALSLSICVKLIPLIFLPALLPLLDRKKAILFYSITILVCILLFLPLLDRELISGFTNSLGYYFSRFEFNASLYYLVRELGYIIFGFNIVHIAGGLLSVIAAILILRISLRRWADTYGFWLTPDNKELLTFIQVIMWSLLIFFLFTTTLHPWYITTLLALSVFTNYRFVILWTGTIFLSYAGYTSKGFNENLWLVGFEYLVVLGYLAYEFLWKKDRSLLNS